MLTRLERGQALGLSPGWAMFRPSDKSELDSLSPESWIYLDHLIAMNWKYTFNHSLVAFKIFYLVAKICIKYVYIIQYCKNMYLQK